MWQILLQNAIAFLLQNAPFSLQNAMILLQIVTMLENTTFITECVGTLCKSIAQRDNYFITKCGKSSLQNASAFYHKMGQFYYKMRQLYKMRWHTVYQEDLKNYYHFELTEFFKYNPSCHRWCLGWYVGVNNKIVIVNLCKYEVRVNFL